MRETSTISTVTDDYVPFGARSFHVADTGPFHVGDTAIVRRFTNRAWFDTLEIDMDSNIWKNEPKTFDFDRIVTSIKGNLVTVDVPLTCPIEAAWGGGEILRYTAVGRISRVGVENQRCMSDFNRTVRTREYGNMDRSPYIGDEYYSDENHYFNFISIDNAENAWVRNVTAL